MFVFCTLMVFWSLGLYVWSYHIIPRSHRRWVMLTIVYTMVLATVMLHAINQVFPFP